MLAAVLALTLGAAADSLRLVVNGRDSALVTRTEPQATYVSADAAAAALDGRLQRLPNHRFLLSVGGVGFELADRSSFALSDGRLYPLMAPARERAGRLEIPVQFFTDVAPRAGARLAWNPVSRRLAVVAARAIAPAPASAAPAMAGVGGTRSQPSGPAAARGVRRRVIVVDAGHGGRDPGMRGWSPDRTPVREKDVVLGVARRLEQELEKRGYAVVMTRSSDTLVALDDRGRIANRSKGDLFISVHVNAANPKWRDPQAARGFETYFLAEAKTEDERRVAQMENEVVRFETDADAPPHEPQGIIINHMAQNEHLRESSDLADGIQRALRRVHPGPSRGVKQAGFRVLVRAYMPAVLVEIGFGTNGAEAAYLSSESGQSVLASAIADAAAEYLGRYEQRVGSGK
jgi:N-acetylmuramoyl-L-alanine amidase